MRNLSVRRIVRILILTAALFFWYRALVLSADMIKQPGCISLRYESGEISLSDVKMMLEKETAPFAAWLQRGGELIEEKEFGRSIPVELLEVAGDAELVIPAGEMRSGFLPVSGNAATCAIDAATAYSLWGSVDVAGETVLYCAKEYTVTGVFTQPENAVLIQSELKENTAFPYLELFVSGVNTAHIEMSEFISRYSLPEPEIIKDNAEMSAMLRCLALLPALVVAAAALWIVLWQIFGKPRSSVVRAGFVLAVTTGIAFTAWAIGFSPLIPAAAIPGRWSDFSFWARLIEDMISRARLSRAFAWPAPDLSRLQDQRNILFYSGKALAGFMLGIFWRTGIKREEEDRDGIRDPEKH